jgi:hypothetical protein
MGELIFDVGKMHPAIGFTLAKIILFFFDKIHYVLDFAPAGAIGL